MSSRTLISSHLRLRIFVTLSVCTAVLLILMACGADDSPPPTPTSPKPTPTPTVAAEAGSTISTEVDTGESAEARVFFAQPSDQAIVPLSFKAIMGAEGLVIEPSGEVHEGAGHLHILVDTEFIEPGAIIPKDETHLHYGDGSVEAEVTLEPGVHMLRLQFADGAHIALDGNQYRDEITVTVE